MNERFIDEHSTTQYGFYANSVFRRNLTEYGASKIDFYSNVYLKIGIQNEDVVLDVGPGDGEDIFNIATRYKPKFIYGIDPPTGYPESFDARFVPLRQRLAAEGIENYKLIRGYAQDLRLDDSSVDVALYFHVLHHVDDWQQALREAKRVTKHGGVVTVLTSGLNNKATHHDFIRDIAASLGRKISPPVSSKFSLDIVKQRLSPYFEITDFYPYQDVMVITEDNLLDYLLSINTYRSFLTPPLEYGEDWSKSLDKNVSKKIEDEIDKNGAFYDIIDVGAVFCRNIKQ